jgi:hypothetical protein
MALVNGYSVKDHFRDKQSTVKAIYDAIVKTAEEFGPVKQDPKKTSIHLVRKSAFAGVATRKSALILTVKSKTDLKSNRVVRRQQASASRWYLYVKVESPDEVDKELKKWLKDSYELSG